MSWFLVAATLTGSPASIESYGSQREVAASLSKQVQTGTLLFSQGDCLAVRVFTQSPYTHVAAVVMRDGRPYVYDSTSGAGVRRQSLTKYLASQSPDVVHVFQPRKQFSKKRRRQFQKHLDSQLGKPYAIKHHLTGERADGIHCSEYVTDALEACQVIRAKQPSRVSPASLVEGIVKADLYTASKTLKLKLKSKPRPKSAGWCGRLWFDTKQCTHNCCVKMQRWFLCR